MVNKHKLALVWTFQKQECFFTSKQNSTLNSMQEIKTSSYATFLYQLNVSKT